MRQETSATRIDNKSNLILDEKQTKTAKEQAYSWLEEVTKFEEQLPNSFSPVCKKTNKNKPCFFFKVCPFDRKDVDTWEKIPFNPNTGLCSNFGVGQADFLW